MHDRVARPMLMDPLINLRVLGLLDGSLGRWRVLPETSHDSVVPQRHPDHGRQLLAGQVVADDPVEADLAVLLRETVLLGGTTEVLGDRLGGRPCVGRHVHGEELDLPAVQSPAAVRPTLGRKDAGHDPNIDGLVGAAVRATRAQTRGNAQDAEVRSGTHRPGEAIRDPVPRRRTQEPQYLRILVEFRPVQPRDEGQFALTAGGEPGDIAELAIHPHERAAATMPDAIAGLGYGIERQLEVGHPFAVASRQVPVQPQRRAVVFDRYPAKLHIAAFAP